MDARTYVKSDAKLRETAPEQLGLSALRLVAGAGRIASLDIPSRAMATLMERNGRPRPTVDPDDPPWCPEDGASWKIHGDPAGMVGGLLALWIQALHPLALAGVMEHSKFEEDPFGRLERTGTFVMTTTFGPGSEAQAAVDLVMRVHQHINGIAPDGRHYSALDGELVDWVHCALLLAMARSWLRYGRRPDAGLLDDYVAEQRHVALSLGDEDPPNDWNDLLEHIERHRPNLAVNSQTRFMDKWLRTPTLPGPWRLMMPAHQMLHSAALAAAPDWVHELYGNRRVLPGRFLGEAFTVGTSTLLGQNR